MKISMVVWEELRGGVLAGVRAGIDTQRTIADEFDRRAAEATGRGREKLARIAADARETATVHEAALSDMEMRI